MFTLAPFSFCYSYDLFISFLNSSSNRILCHFLPFQSNFYNTARERYSIHRMYENKASYTCTYLKLTLFRSMSPFFQFFFTSHSVSILPFPFDLRQRFFCTFARRHRVSLFLARFSAIEFTVYKILRGSKCFNFLLFPATTALLCSALLCLNDKYREIKIHHLY